jgi:hypothetical protein
VDVVADFGEVGVVATYVFERRGHAVLLPRQL